MRTGRQEFQFEQQAKKKPKKQQGTRIQNKNSKKGVLYLYLIFVTLGIGNHFYLNPGNFGQRLIVFLIFILIISSGLVWTMYISSLMDKRK